MTRVYKLGTTKIISDLHFGRKFRTGVPLNRRGEIEDIIYNETCNEINKDDYEDLIIAGDLFDSPFADSETIFKVYELLINAPKNIYIIAGNHDLSRDPSKKTAWDILDRIFEGISKNVCMFKSEVSLQDNGILLVPWGQEEQADVMFEENFNVVIGHFEQDSLSKMPNLVKKGCKFLSGHYHLPQLLNGIEYVGSILPLTFGEYDRVKDFDYMRTMSLDEYERDKDSLTNVRVRIRLKDGEELPVDEENGPLQLIGVKDLSDQTDELSLKVETSSDLDLKNLFYKNLDSCKRKDELWFKYIQMKGATD